jgi:hypothetical protein
MLGQEGNNQWAWVEVQTSWLQESEGIASTLSDSNNGAGQRLCKGQGGAVVLGKDRVLLCIKLSIVVFGLFLSNEWKGRQCRCVQVYADVQLR